MTYEQIAHAIIEEAIQIDVAEPGAPGYACGDKQRRLSSHAQCRNPRRALVGRGRGSSGRPQADGSKPK
jgi:hypothetical protein